MNNQECEIKAEVIDIKSNKSLFHPYSIFVKKCSGICNNVNIHMLNFVFLMLLKT